MHKQMLINITSQILIDALNPVQSVTLQQARRYVCKLVAGLERNGIQPGDTVCVHLFNNVRAAHANRSNLSY